MNQKIPLSPQYYGEALKKIKRAKGDKAYWKEVKLLLKSDFLFLCYTLGYEDVGTEFHLGFMGWLMKFERGEVQKGLALLPRGHLKTTLMQAFIIRQAIVRAGNIRIGVASWDLKTAISMTASIKLICERNEILKKAYPEIFHAYQNKAHTWRLDSFKLKGLPPYVKESTVEAFDINEPPMGKHYDAIIYDDIVDRERAGIADARSRLRESFDLTYPILEPGGMQVMVGTPYHYYDLYSDIREGRMGKDWQVLVKPITKPDGKLLWPERFVKTNKDRELLSTQLRQEGIKHPKIISVEELKASLLPHVYYAQYEMQTLPPSDIVFTSDDIIMEEPPETGLIQYIVGVDPAKTVKEKSANTAFVVISVYEGKRMFVEEVVNDKLPTVDILDVLFRLANVYSEMLVAVEQTGWEDLIRLIEEEQTQRGVYFNLIALRPKGSKIDRVKNVVELAFKRGQIKFRPHLNSNAGFKALRTQILDFPQCNYWDAIDALTNAISQVDHPGEIKEKKTEPYSRLGERLKKYENSINYNAVWS